MWIAIPIFAVLLLLLTRLSIRIKYTDKVETEIRYGFIRLDRIIGKLGGKKKKKKPDAPKEKKSMQGGEKTPITETVTLVLEILRAFCPRFFKRFRIKAARILISVGAGDPAKTAVYYGAVVQAVALIVDFLGDHTDFKTSKKTVIRVDPDFLSGRTRAEIDICLSLTPMHVISSGAVAALAYFKHKSRSKAKNKADTDVGKGLV